MKLLFVDSQKELDVRSELQDNKMLGKIII